MVVSKTVPFFVLSKSKTPDYLYQEIPEQQIVEYNLRNTFYYEPNLSRTIRFSNSYFSNILDEWNKLDTAVQRSPSISVFKRNLLQIIRPIKIQSTTFVIYWVLKY